MLKMEALPWVFLDLWDRMFIPNQCPAGIDPMEASQDKPVAPGVGLDPLELLCPSSSSASEPSLFF